MNETLGTNENGNCANRVLAAAFVLSGDCRLGDVGEATPLIDNAGNALFVGDIVITSTIDKFGICSNNGLTVVCSNKWTSYSDGSHVVKKEPIEYFIMGIKNVDFMGADSEHWIVNRVKSYSDVIAGEKWPEFGFSYSAD
jgi:hypothetical protein